jgi:hypothetical protein
LRTLLRSKLPLIALLTALPAMPVSAPLRATLPRPAAEVSGVVHAALDRVSRALTTN